MTLIILATITLKLKIDVGIAKMHKTQTHLGLLDARK